jgi:hypothetical protein
MQTFITAIKYDQCARVLDDKRLNKQRIEAKQILLALSNPSYGWRNHPAVRMWKGLEPDLACYGEAMCWEWRIMRGKNDDKDLLNFFRRNIPTSWAGWSSDGVLQYSSHAHQYSPTRFTNTVIDSHRSNLVRKMPERYRHFWPTIPDNLPYVWPHNTPLGDYAYPLKP